jgi:hypothetical protein
MREHPHDWVVIHYTKKKKNGRAVLNAYGHMRRTTLNRHCMSILGGNFVGYKEERADMTL